MTLEETARLAAAAMWAGDAASKALGIAVDSRFKDKDVRGLANEIRRKPHGQAILIVWHHGEIPALVRALGADPAAVIPNAKWPEDVFGWVIELRYDVAGRLVETKRINQQLLPDDLNRHSEKETEKISNIFLANDGQTVAVPA